jgi:hypothetical protein
MGLSKQDSLFLGLFNDTVSRTVKSLEDEVVMAFACRHRGEL